MEFRKMVMITLYEKEKKIYRYIITLIPFMKKQY